MSRKSTSTNIEVPPLRGKMVNLDLRTRGEMWGKVWEVEGWVAVTSLSEP